MAVEHIEVSSAWQVACRGVAANDRSIFIGETHVDGAAADLKTRDGILLSSCDFGAAVLLCRIGGLHIDLDMIYVTSKGISSVESLM